MALCFVTRRLPGGALERLAHEHEVDLWEGPGPPPPQQLRARARAADGLLCMLTDRVDAALIEGSPRLRAISNYAVGSDNVDLGAAAARRIPVGVTADVLTETTADLAFALILAAARRLVEGDAAVRRGQWPPWEPDGFLGRDVHRAALGIVGRGRIGAAVARRAEGFSMTVAHSSASGGARLEELLAESDFVSIHCPLTAATRGLIDARALRLMRPTAYLVNTARGPIVESGALGRALGEGWLAGAALDVTDPEPLPGDHPLLEAPNLTVVPHVGSATHATRAAMADLAVDNLLAALSGRELPAAADPPG